MSDKAREWDRRKAYLIRCLFEDLPLLSPIPERREPDQSDIEDPYILPDLIIEREKNHHDDTEEFYEELEKRMLKLYRKLFHCQHEEGSVLSICSVSSHGTRELNNYETREDSDNEVSNRIDHESVRVPEDSIASQMIHESYQSIETERSEEPGHEVITTQALIHAGELSQKRNRAVLKKQESMAVQSPILECKHTEQIIQDWDEQSTQDATFGTTSSILESKPWRPSIELLDENMAGLVAKQATTQKYSNSSCYEFGVYDFSPIEVMRQEGSKNPKASILEVRHSRGSSKEPEFDRNLNEKETSPVQEEQSFIEEEMISDESSESGRSDGDLLNEALKEVTIISSPILDTTSRKRLLSDISKVEVESPRKRVKYKNIGQQTIEGSFSYVTQPSRDLSPTDFFFGTPMIFNVCSCSDHICVPTCEP